MRMAGATTDRVDVPMYWVAAIASCVFGTTPTARGPAEAMQDALVGIGFVGVSLHRPSQYRGYTPCGPYWGTTPVLEGGPALTVHTRATSVLGVHTRGPTCALTVHTRGHIRTDGTPLAARTEGTPRSVCILDITISSMDTRKRFAPEGTRASVLTVHTRGAGHMRTEGTHPRPLHAHVLTARAPSTALERQSVSVSALAV